MEYENGRVCELPEAAILPNPSQPRRAFSEAALARLTDSIRMYGILQPLTVRRLGAPLPVAGALPCGPEQFELIAGERRLRAARLAGLSTVPCVVIITDHRTSAELAIIENIHREDLNMFEQAAAMASLIDLHGLTQEELAHQLASSQSAVANKLRLLRLTEAERRLVLEANLTERHVRTVLRLRDASDRLAAFRHIAAQDMNVAAAEQYIERLLGATAAKATQKGRRGAMRRLGRADLRLFYNSIDRAVSLMRSYGIEISSETRTAQDYTELVLRIPGNVSRETFP